MNDNPCENAVKLQELYTSVFPVQLFVAYPVSISIKAFGRDEPFKIAISVLHELISPVIFGVEIMFVVGISISSPHPPPTSSPRGSVRQGLGQTYLFLFSRPFQTLLSCAIQTYF